MPLSYICPSSVSTENRTVMPKPRAEQISYGGMIIGNKQNNHSTDYNIRHLKQPRKLVISIQQYKTTQPRNCCGTPPHNLVFLHNCPILFACPSFTWRIICLTSDQKKHIFIFIYISTFYPYSVAIGRIIFSW